MGDGTWGTSLPAHSSPAISTLSLKTKISFKTGAATAVTVTPFYTLKPELPPKSPMLGSSDLLTAYDLGAVYSRYCGAKKMREDLNSFLPQIYGNFNFSQAQDISSLKMLVEKPPITGKEINTLSSTAMSGFRLTPGPVDERYRYLFEKKREGDGMPVIYDMERKDYTAFQRYKNSLDSLDGDEPERKKHKSEKKEKKKKKDKKKKDKKDEERKHRKTAEGGGPTPPVMMEF
ncbi:hypothetical protein Aduo_007599 [Ancylostoma duodenale]